MGYRIAKAIIVFAFGFGVLMVTSSPTYATDNCAGLNETYGVPWLIQNFTLACCNPAQGNQYYRRSLSGGNYSTYYSGNCFEEAPCEGVIFENVFGSHVAKFAFRFEAISGGANNCPTAPRIRWRNLPYSGGLIHASPYEYISLFNVPLD